MSRDLLANVFFITAIILLSLSAGLRWHEKGVLRDLGVSFLVAGICLFIHAIYWAVT